MFESPKFLLAQQRDAEATQTVKDIAALNKQQTWLTEASFARIDSSMDSAEQTAKATRSTPWACLGAKGLLRLSLLWATLGLTFPLYDSFIQTYLATKGVTAVTASTVSRKYLYSRRIYLSLCAISGPIISGILIEVKFIGRKHGGALVAIFAGIFMLLSTLARSRDALLAFECIVSFLHFAALAILTTYTVKVFPASCRGAGLGFMGFWWRFLGLIAWIVVTYALEDVAGGAAVWFCGAIWIVIAGVWVVVGKETVATAAM